MHSYIYTQRVSSKNIFEHIVILNLFYIFYYFFIVFLIIFFLYIL